VILAAVDARATEDIVRGLWADFQRDGLVGVLPWADEEAAWHPHSAGTRRFATTADYAKYVAESTRDGETVEAELLGVWVDGDVGITRGRMRVRRRGQVLQDTRMYWLFRVADGKVCTVRSSPDLGALLRAEGRSDPALLQAAFLGLHGTVAD
jgi:ketosteroid isomerase-like protein